MKKLIKIAVSLVVIIVIALLGFSARLITSAAFYNKNVKGYTGEILHPTGDFIQPWMCKGWEISDFENHLDYLAQAGYDTVLWQYTREGVGSECSVYYPSAGLAEKYAGTVYTDNSDLTAKLLEAAENKGFKAFLGLSIDDNWWTMSNYKDKDWMTSLAEIDNMMAGELYVLYKELYPNAFYGWYWAWELFTFPLKYETAWASMINLTLSYLTSLDASMPLLFSPFINKLTRFYPMNTRVTTRMWERFFSLAEFRQGDIFAPQDSIGKISGPHLEMRKIYATDNYLAACRAAMSANANLSMWVNCELFASENNFSPEGSFLTADLERIRAQFVTASAYADALISFSYSHYCVPDAPNGTAADQTAYHTSYVEMIAALNG